MINMKKGFTMLFAVLISSLLLSIGVAILDLTLKEFALSSAGKSSQFAFYAADDAAECALYWENHNNNPSAATSTDSSFATSSESYPFLTFNCHGQPVSKDDISIAPPEEPQTVITNPTPSTTEAVTSFWTSYTGTINGPCAHVVVTKTTNDDDGLVSTVIDSRGYDTCDPNNPYRTERGLQALF